MKIAYFSAKNWQIYWTILQRVLTLNAARIKFCPNMSAQVLKILSLR